MMVLKMVVMLERRMEARMVVMKAAVLVVMKVAVLVAMTV